MIRTLRHGNEQLEYTVHYKKMKHIRIRVDSGRVVVSCAGGVPLHTVERCVKDQWQWIGQALETQRRKREGVIPEHYGDGEAFSYLGVTLAIRAVTGKRQKAEIRDGILYMPVYRDDAEARRKAFRKWFSLAAREVIADRLDALYPQFCREIGKKPAIAFRSMKTRWGSAQPVKRKIVFNTALLHAPVALIDYVVAHELSHFVHPNHSNEFYAVLAAHMPDWKQRKQTLHENYTTM